MCVVCPESSFIHIRSAFPLIVWTVTFLRRSVCDCNYSSCTIIELVAANRENKLAKPCAGVVRQKTQ